MSLELKDYYEKMFYSGGINALLTKHIHKALEQKMNSKFSKVLEIGGGEGFHLQYVNHPYDKYYLTDIDLRTLCEFAKKIWLEGKLIQKYQDSAKLTFKSNTFDRVIFMCVLHHVNDVVNSIKEARRVCKNGGVISIYLPTDPGIIYRFMRRMVTARQASRLAIDYEYLNALGHRNHFYSIMKLLQHQFQFDDVRIKRKPFKINSYNLNLYYIIHINIRK